MSSSTAQGNSGPKSSNNAVDDDNDDDMWFDGIDEDIAENPSMLYFQIYNYCKQNGGFFLSKFTSPFGKSFHVFEQETGQTIGSYRYRCAGQWLDRAKSASDYGFGNKIIIEAWPRGALVTKYCHSCTTK